MEKPGTILSYLSVQYGVRNAFAETIPMATTDMECDIAIVYGHSHNDDI